MQNHLHFLSFTPESFAGINTKTAKDVVFVFPEDHPRIIEISADQGQRKTSLLQFIKAMLGGELPVNATNSIDDDMRGTCEFEADGIKYTVRMTKSGFTVKYTDENGVGTKGSPKQYLQNLIGNIGLSPMVLKEKKGKDQIAWIREVCKLTTEEKTLEKRILDGHQKAYDKRTDANREYDRLKKELQATGYYAWDIENKVLLTTNALKEDTATVETNNFNDEEITKKHKDAQGKVRVWNQANDAVGRFKFDEELQQKNVDELTRKLEEAKELLAQTKQQIEKGTGWLSENKNPQKELDDALLLMKNSGTIQMIKTNLQSASGKLTEFLNTEEQKIQLEGEIEEYKVQQKEFIKATTPPIEGLEMIIGDWHPEKSEGLYYKGHTPAELSESETWEFYLKLCQALNIKVSIIENISSLGSAAMEVIQAFADQGGYVFCSKMDRTQKDISISFHHKYPV